MMTSFIGKTDRRRGCVTFKGAGTISFEQFTHINGRHHADPSFLAIGFLLLGALIEYVIHLVKLL